MGGADQAATLIAAARSVQSVSCILRQRGSLLVDQRMVYESLILQQPTEGPTSEPLVHLYPSAVCVALG